MSDLEYRTKNIQLAAFILARGADLPDIRGERGHCDFCFPDPEGKLGWEWEEFKADSQVGVQQFIWAQKEIRAQLDKKFGPRR